MGHRSWKHLVVPSAAAAALAGLVVASSASAAKTTPTPTVALKVKVTGSGSVRLKGRHPFICRAASCTHTFYVLRGRRITVKALPLTGWKLTTWAGACEGSATTCSLRLKKRRSIAVTFVPPGDRMNPYPLGTAVTTSDSWVEKVNSATINADAAVEAVPNPPPPAGDQYAVVNVSITYVGSGSPYADDFVCCQQQLVGQEAGDAKPRYFPAQCFAPPPDLFQTTGKVYSGQTVTGNLCYRITSSGANTLLLSGYVPRPGGGVSQEVWFNPLR
jgi:hypothetical protein